jgi:phage recombination protein Bet
MTDNLPTTINFDDPKIVKILKATVARDATDEEFAMFAQFCQSTRLNPFKREIWFIKVNGRVQMMTGINGFFAIANSHPQFDGLECELDLDEKTGQPVKAIAKAHRKDRKFPAVGIALLRESKGGSPIWNSQPSVMLSKVAKARALREAFPQEMGGLYTDDEMPKEYAAVTVEAAPAEVKRPEPVLLNEPLYYDLSEAKLTSAQMERLSKFCTFDEQLGAYACKINLGPKFDQYRVVVGKSNEAEQGAESLSGDDLPESMGGPAEEEIPYEQKEEKIDHLKRIQERVRKENEAKKVA